MKLQTVFNRAMEQLLPHRPPCIGVAVSGGSDSLALSMLAIRAGWTIMGLTVEHGLRPESAAEAQQVSAWYLGKGLVHRILPWREKPPQKGIPAAARRARYRLLSRACREAGITHCLVGHSEDDQAETVALQHLRGAGSFGLCGMSAQRNVDGVVFLRPLLKISRAALRTLLSEAGESWLDDPGNANALNPRIAIRQRLAQNPRERAYWLALAAENLPQRLALERVQQSWAKQVTWHAEGYASFLLAEFASLEPAARCLALGRLVQCFSGEDYPPRFSSVARVLTGLDKGQICSLAGLLLIPQAAHCLMVPDGRILSAAWQFDNMPAFQPLGETGRRLLKNHLPPLPHPAIARALPAAWQKPPEALEAAPCLPHIAGMTLPQAITLPSTAYFAPAKALVTEGFCCIN